MVVIRMTTFALETHVRACSKWQQWREKESSLTAQQLKKELVKREATTSGRKLDLAERYIMTYASYNLCNLQFSTNRRAWLSIVWNNTPKGKRQRVLIRISIISRIASIIRVTWILNVVFDRKNSWLKIQWLKITAYCNW